MSDAVTVPTVRDESGWFVVDWPDPRPRSFEITAEAFELLIARANDAADWRKMAADKSHTIEFRDDGWTIQHPLSERLNGTLFDCRVNWDDSDPGVRGRYTLTDDGEIDTSDEVAS